MKEIALAHICERVFINQMYLTLREGNKGDCFGTNQWDNVYKSNVY